jgi:hypothetical protein
LARAFLWEYSYERLKLAQLLGQLGVFLPSLLSVSNRKSVSYSVFAWARRVLRPKTAVSGLGAYGNGIRIRRRVGRLTRWVGRQFVKDLMQAMKVDEKKAGGKVKDAVRPERSSLLSYSLSSLIPQITLGSLFPLLLLNLDKLCIYV